MLDRLNFTEEDAKYIEANPAIFRGNARVKGESRDFLYLTYNRVFNDSKKPSPCGACLRSVIDNLNKAYKLYQEQNGRKTEEKG